MRRPDPPSAEPDVAAIQRLLEEHKAAALTGLAGVGKSTVARCVAEAWCAKVAMYGGRTWMPMLH